MNKPIAAAVRIMEDYVEIWKQIPSWSNYLASDAGKIKQISSDRVLKEYESEGYLIVKVSKPGLSRTIRVQYLIAEAFLGEKPKGYNLHHKDENKHNNKPTNLEYLPECKHRSYHQSGQNNNSSRLKYEDIYIIRELIHEGYNSQYIANIFSVGRSTIKDIKLGRTWTDF